MRPDYYWAHMAWAKALAAQAESHSGEKAIEVWSRAVEHYREVVAVRPDWIAAQDGLLNATINSIPIDE